MAAMAAAVTAALALLALLTTSHVAAASSQAPTVVVIGSGLAGLTAALEAASRGAQVTILEKEGKLGGNSAKASSGINAAGSRWQRDAGVDDTPAKHQDDTIASGRGLANKELVKVLTEESAAAIDFLYSAGLNLSKLSQCGGHSVPRTHREPDKDGKARPVGWGMVSALLEVVKANEDIKVITNAKVVRLLTENRGSQLPAVIGVAYELNGNTIDVHSGAVVLATGGYGSDRNGFLRQYAPRLAFLPTTNGPWASGDGIRLADKVGADFMHMEHVQVHPTAFVDPLDTNARVKFLAPEALRGAGGILINRQGQRFVNELGLRDAVVTAIYRSCSLAPRPEGFDLMAEFPRPAEAILLMTNKTVKRFGKNAFSFYLDQKRFFTEVSGAGGISLLINNMLDPDDDSIPRTTAAMINDTLKQYNEDAQSGMPDYFGKAVFPDDFSNATHPATTFYVARVTPAIHYTMGGVRFDAGGRVFRTSQTGASEAIPGLFAAGEVTGGLHGANRLAGNSLLECVVFGRQAAASAVTEQV